MTKRLRGLAARIRRTRRTTPPAAAPKFNEPPIFPTDALLPRSAELAVPADARPYSIATPSNCPRPATGKVLRPSHPESPYQFADATVHAGDTAIPVNGADGIWPPGTTIVGIDGDVIIQATVAEDGTVTAVIPAAADEPAPPPRPRRPPNGCPCTAIYSTCHCPERP